MRRYHLWLCFVALLIVMLPVQVFGTSTISKSTTCETSIDVTMLESRHAYAPNTNRSWQVKAPGALRITLTFDDRTEVEKGFDFIEILDKNGKRLARYTGKMLAGKTVSFDESILLIRLTANDSNQKWGFKVVKAVGDAHVWSEETVPHSLDAAGRLIPGKIIYTCEVCKTVREEVTNDTHHDWQETDIIPHAVDAKGEIIPGKTVYTCRVCSAKKEEQNEDDHHLWEVVDRVETIIHEDDTTEDGSMTSRCTICGEEKTERVRAVKATWTDDYVFYSDGTLAVKTNRCAIQGALRDRARRLVFKEDVSSIPEHAYQGCTILAEVVLPDGITDIGSGAFQQCSSLQKVTLPSSLKTLGESAFEGCTGLDELIIPASVTRIGKSAFRDSGIRRFYFQGSPSFDDAEEPLEQGCFSGVTADVFYDPANAPTQEQFGGKLNWISMGKAFLAAPEDFIEVADALSAEKNSLDLTEYREAQHEEIDEIYADALQRIASADTAEAAGAFVDAAGKRFSEVETDAALTILEEKCPEITGSRNLNAGTEVSWEKVEDANSYSLLRRSDKQTEWTAVATDITATSYTVPNQDLLSGTKYFYAVKAIYDRTESKPSPEKAQTWMQAPAVTETRNDSSGTQVSWESVTGAASYIVMYKTGDGDWKTAGSDVTGTSFIVPKDLLKSGTKYTFTVKAKGASSSGYSSGKAHTYVAAPTVNETKNLSAGTKVTWGKVTGAKTYSVMYKPDGGEWKTAKSGLTGTSYTVPESKLDSGTKYYFSVKAVGNAASGIADGKAQTYIAAPSVKETKNVSAGTKVTWGKVAGAKTYTVMYKVKGGDWKIAESGLTETSYTVPKGKLSSGKKYYFTVRASGNASSGYTGGKAHTYVAAPTVKTTKNVSAGTKVTWEKVTGAKTYTVMYKAEGGDWKNAKSGLSGTSYTVPESKLTSGKKYYITVKAVGNASSGYTGGKAQTFVAAPTVSAVKESSYGVTLTWDAQPGANTYTVMYKAKGGDWKTAGKGVTGTSYTIFDSKLDRGTTYSFTVKAVGNASSGYTSGKSLTYMDRSRYSSAGLPGGTYVLGVYLSPGDNYVVNTKKGVFHETYCHAQPTVNYFRTGESREYLIANGFTPCGKCHP